MLDIAELEGNVELLQFKDSQNIIKKCHKVQIVSFFSFSFSKAERGRPKDDRAKRLQIFLSKVGCFIGKILGLRQTKKGVKIVATAGR